MEKLDFNAWARYYEKGDHEKYNVKVANWLPLSLLDEPEAPETIEPIEPVQTSKREKTQEDIKKSLLSRLSSAERLLYNFVHVWPDDVYNRLHQGLSDLKREITMMRTASSMVDRIVRTASIWEGVGFIEGANELRKIAQPPEDITSEIEKALTGREYEGKPKSEEAPMPDMPEAPMPDATMPDLPEPPPIEDTMSEEPGAPPAGVEESLPPAEKLPEVPEKGSLENLYSSATVQDVLEVLEPLSQKLREREFIRDLSKADMMLDALNIASHFPELGEAQAKALELNIYVGTRLEKVISKLKGGVKEEEDEGEQTPPGIEMEELNKPEAVPEKKPEETAFEVVEEAPPAPKIPNETI